MKNLILTLNEKVVILGLLMISVLGFFGGFVLISNNGGLEKIIRADNYMQNKDLSEKEFTDQDIQVSDQVIDTSNSQKRQGQILDGVNVSMVSIYINIDNDNKGNKTYDIEFKEDETAFDLLTRLENNDKDFSFSYKEYDFGNMITEINQRKVDDKEEFWQFSVNQKVSDKGVSDYKIKQGDVIMFSIEKIS